MRLATGVEQPARAVSQGYRKDRTQPTIEFERFSQVSGNDVYRVEDSDVVGHGIHQQTAGRRLGITPPARACKMAESGARGGSGPANCDTPISVIKLEQGRGALSGLGMPRVGPG